ncbi:hypothetical protein SAMN04488603_11366 [Paenibacillus sp. cl130]|nr:hypothetical protein C1T21_20260 [Paenibacillus sp. F4]SFR27114.1 hypothetical protein SAMN04488603_11366 [Paenibacillus sp. cl130]
MYTLIDLNKIYKIYYSFVQHQSLFDSFSNVYLFGSILSLNKILNDVDILLVYDELTNKVLYDSEEISSIMYEYSGIQIDMTILSQNEFEETDFLCKLRGKYLKIK